MALTDVWLKANHNKQRDKSEEHSDRDGLSVRVSTRGRITFQLRFRHSGKAQRVDIGTYPLVSLKDAREQAVRYKKDISKGIDPRITKKVEKTKNTEAISLETLFAQWYKKYCAVNKKNAEIIKRIFEKNVFKKLGVIPPDNISTEQWMQLLEALTKKKPFIANEILLNTKQMLAWAKRRNLITNNALEKIGARRDLNIVSVPGKRSLNDDEIKMLFKALRDSKMMYRNKLLIRLCLVYGCRSGELKYGLKSDVDFDKMIWRIPPERHKTGKSTEEPLVRPIIEETKELFKECLLLDDSEYLIGKNHNVSTELGSDINKFMLKTYGYVMEHWSLHDLRKTARTNFSKFTQPHIAEIMLGHKLPGIWQTYDKHDYLEEQAECLKLWCEKLNRLEKESLD